MHINFKTDDIRWAVTYAGALNDAMDPKYSGINAKVTISFESDNELVKYLAQSFNPKPADCIEHEDLLLSDYNAIDQFAHMQQVKSLRDEHGVITEKPMQLQNIQGLASYQLLLKYKLANKPGFFFPPVGKPERSATILCGSRDLEAICIAFAEGLGEKNPTIIYKDEVSELEFVKIGFKGCRAIIVDGMDPMLYVFRAFYRGVDTLRLNTPILPIIDEEKMDERAVCFWAGTIPPVPRNVPLEMVTRRAESWEVRRKYDFNYHKFLKEYIANNGRIRV